MRDIADIADFIAHNPRMMRCLAVLAAHGPAGDVLHQVAAAFELGDDPQHRHQVPQVPGHRGLEHHRVLQEGLELLVDRVDAPVPLDDLASQLAVGGEQRLRGRLEAVRDQREELVDPSVDVLDVALQVRDGHAGDATEGPVRWGRGPTGLPLMSPWRHVPVREMSPNG